MQYSSTHIYLKSTSKLLPENCIYIIPLRQIILAVLISLNAGILVISAVRDIHTENPAFFLAFDQREESFSFDRPVPVHQHH